MADDLYIVDQLVTGTSTVTLTDDGSGSDTLKIIGVYAVATSIDLKYATNLGVVTAADALYFNPDSSGHRLVVNGIIENAIGSNGQDFIQGNEFGNLISGDNLASGGGQVDTLWGGDGNDTIYGGDGGDGILGDDGNDALFGDAGADTIAGGAGADTIEGGAGADALSGGATTGDTVSYAHSSAGVQVQITFGTTTTGHFGDAAGDQLTGFLNVTGSAKADQITDTVAGTVAFGQNDNAFWGAGGNDTLMLGGGNDTGYGGTGNDTVKGEAGRDHLWGDAGADHLYGGAGDDHLNGGAGRDVLTGGNGRDTLTGGLGADHFVYANYAESSDTVRDTISDFRTADLDKIDLRLLDASSILAGNQAFHFIGSANFGLHAGELRFEVSGSDLFVLGDRNGDGAADIAIRLAGVAAVSATDFLL